MSNGHSRPKHCTVKEFFAREEVVGINPTALSKILYYKVVVTTLYRLGRVKRAYFYSLKFSCAIGCWHCQPQIAMEFDASLQVRCLTIRKLAFTYVQLTISFYFVNHLVEEKHKSMRKH